MGRLWKVVSVLVAGVAAGCSGGGGAPEGGPASVAPSASGTPALVQVGVPPADARQLQLAEETLIRECMKKKGLEYTFTPPAEVKPQAPFERADDVEYARKHGYGTVERLKEAAADGQDPNKPRPDPNTDGMSEAEKKRYLIALRGTGRGTAEVANQGQLVYPTSGCVADAARRLYKDPGRWSAVQMLVDNFNNFALNRSLKDPDYLATMKRWSACVKDKGYPFENTEEAYETAAESYRGVPDQPAKKEIEIAVEDALCDKKTGLSDAKESAYEKQLKLMMEEHEGELVFFQEAQRTALDVAKDVLR